MGRVATALSVVGRVASFALILLLVVVAALAVVALLANLSERELTTATAGAVLRLVSTLLAVLLSGLLLGLLLEGVRRLYRVRDRVRSTALGVLVGLALAALTFPRGIYALLAYPPWYTIRAARQLFDFNAPGSTAVAADAKPTMSGAILLDELGVVMWGFATRLLDTAREFWDALPVRDVLLALAVWVLIASLFSPAVDGQGQTRFRRWWSGLDARGRAHAGVFTALLVGTYLSIAAIIAIPWLEGDETQNQALTKDQLQQQLLRSDSAIARTSVPFVADSMAFLTATSLLKATTDTALARLKGTLRGVANNDLWQRLVLDVQTSLEQARAARRRFITLADRRRESLRSSLKDMVERAVNSYATQSSQQMTSAERAIFFQDMVTWAREGTDNSVTILDQLVESVSREDASAIGWANGERNDLEYALTVLSQSRDTLDKINPMTLMGLPTPPTLFSEYSLPATSLIIGRLPSPPEPGAGWGPFGTVARWLLRTRAVALAQIAGMLGFGLFGAAISLLRWRGQDTTGDQNATGGMDDVTSVLLNGFSATMVIFLAVKGGLAAFTQGTTEPDSYVLFFACLVGAVFSQDVWKWARDRLGRTLSGT